MVAHNTFTLERSFAAAPARVFAAFSSTERKRRWFVDGGGHTVEYYEFAFEVGGRERAGLRLGPETPVPNMLCESMHEYLDIVEQRRIVCAATMAVEGRTISASLLTFEFEAEGNGTKLLFTHQAAFFPPL